MMVLQVLCPECCTRYEVADEQAGQTGTCPACGTVARIPAVHAPIAAPPRENRPPTNSAVPCAAGQLPGDPNAPAYGADQAYFHQWVVAQFEVHRKLIGVFGIIVGTLCILWSALYGFIAAMVYLGEGFPNPPPEPEAEIVAAICAVLAVPCIGTGILQLAAGVSLLQRRRGCRKLGIAAGVVSCMSIWTYLVWFICLGFGIYALVILCGRNAVVALEAPD